jgi:uncharacterized protein (DUF952 family)
VSRIEVYAQDGFIHLTKDPAFLLGVANNFYLAKDPWEWLCLRIEPSRLSSEVHLLPRSAWHACMRDMP